MTIYLLRHGETDWNRDGILQGREDVPLNGRGVDQARSLIPLINVLGVGAVYSSPLSRASETARILAAAASLPAPRVLESLTERDFGESSGLTREERSARFPDEDAVLGQEGYRELQARALGALETMVHEGRSERVLAVSHGAFIDSIVKKLQGRAFGGMSALRPGNCRMARIDRNGEDWRLRYSGLDPGEVLRTEAALRES